MLPAWAATVGSRIDGEDDDNGATVALAAPLPPPPSFAQARRDVQIMHNFLVRYVRAAHQRSPPVPNITERNRARYMYSRAMRALDTPSLAEGALAQLGAVALMVCGWAQRSNAPHVWTPLASDVCLVCATLAYAIDQDPRRAAGYVDAAADVWTDLARRVDDARSQPSRQCAMVMQSAAEWDEAHRVAMLHARRLTVCATELNARVALGDL